MKMRNKILAGAAAAAAGAAATGYYFYGSKNAKKNRDTAVRWANDFKKDIVNQAEELRKVDRAALVGIVDGVTRAYSGVRSLDRKDLMRAAAELKDNWEKLRDELRLSGNAAKREAQKTMKENGVTIRRGAKKMARKVTKAMRKK